MSFLSSRRLRAAVAAFLLFLPFSAFAASADFAPRTGPIRVGVYNFYPLCQAAEPATGSAQTRQGLFVDLLAHVAQREKWELTYVVDTMPRLVERLRAGEIDLVVAVSPRGNLAEGLAFTRETVISTWARAFATRAVKIESPIDLAGRSVGLMRDDPYNSEVRSVVARLDIDCAFVEFAHYSGIFEGLENGWIDVGVVDRLYAALHAADFRVDSSPVLFSPIELRFAARQGRMEGVLAVLDYHLEMMKRDPDSAYHRLIETYLNRSDVQPVPQGLIWAMGITSGLLIVVGLLSFFLRHQVKRKTAELSEKNRDLQNEVRMRRQADAALTRQREELARLAMVIKQSPDSVIIADPDGVVDYVNPAFEIQTEIGSHEIQARPLGDFSDRSPLCRVAASILGDAPGEAPVLLERVAVPRDEGGKATIETAVSIVRDELGGVRNYVINCRDVTRETQLESQLRQAQKMEAIGTLSGGIAHDFNNLLVPIIGYAEMLGGRLEGRERDYVAKILEAASRAKDLVEQILAFSRRSEEETRVLDIRQVVRDALRLLRASLPATIEVREEVADGCGCVLGDGSQMHQVVMNLCTNAYHAMREDGGVLTVAMGPYVVDSSESAPAGLAVPGGRYVRLTVQDTGHGMDEALLSRIFDPYFTTKAQGDGTGLGLSIVHGIVQKHGGCITVDSRVGKGSRFDIYLPATETTPLRAVIAEAPDARPGEGNEHVLLVDDEENVIAMQRDMLTDMGYRVTSEKDGKRALELVRREPYRFDLVITDQTMPGMSGLELAREIAVVRADLPVILCTGYSRAVTPESVRELGLKACVRKPFSRADMLRAVRQAVQTA